MECGSLLEALGLIENNFERATDSVKENGKIKITTGMSKKNSAEADRNICVVSIVGAGGKTTCLRRLQLECKKLGIRAAAGTTTHIQYERNEAFLDRPDMGAAREILKKTGTLWMGEPVSGWKCKGLPDSFYRELLADGVRLLLEADGAKERPVKAPRNGEPVLLSDTDLVLCVYGLDAVGQTIRDACCRVEQVCAILGKEEEDVLTAADLAKLALSPAGGRKGVEPGMRYAVLFNKADTPERESAAREAARQIEKSLAKNQFSDREMREKTGSAEWRESMILTASHLMPPWKPHVTGEPT